MDILYDNRVIREQKLEAAIQAYHRKKRTSITAVAREFDVPRRTLSYRLHGRKSRFQPRPSQTRLSEAEDLALSIYCQNLEETGVFVRRRHLIAIAESLLLDRAEYQSSDLPPPKLGRTWPYRWCKRHPELGIDTLQSLEVSRKMAHDPVVISRWFSQYQTLYTELGLYKEDIWNFDETGFRIGVGRAQKVVRSKKFKAQRTFLASTTSRDYVTCIEAISAAGATIPSFIIFKGKELL
jgi:transposase-like protein